MAECSVICNGEKTILKHRLNKYSTGTSGLMSRRKPSSSFLGWSLFALVFMLAAGCSRTNDAEVSKLSAELDGVKTELAKLKTERGEIDALKTEVANLKAENQALKAEVKRKRVADAVVDVKDLKASLPSRLQTAERLTNPRQRDEAYAGLAQDAATLGEVEMVQKCIDRLAGSIKPREEAKYKAALRLAHAGKTEKAVSLAQTLNNITLRDRALTKIAGGDYQD
jgi:cell division protein FtsB